MLIRDEQPGDFDAIHKLVASAFPTDAEARLVDLLRAAGRLHVSLVAVQDEQIIGHVAFSPVTTANDTSHWLGLAPLAVTEAKRRRGVGAALVRAGLHRCGELESPFVVVLGEPDYYGRFGFRAAAKFGLYDAYGGGAAFQVLDLRDTGAPCVGGLVQYAPEFAIRSGGETP